MPCTGRLAAAWQFASFWCYGNTINGTHGGAGPVDAALSDVGGQFATKGVLANVGMILSNLTANTSGQVTAVTNTTITATGVTWAAGAIYRITLITGIERSTIEHYLDIAASDIHAALAAVGACDCVWASWAPNFLAKLNIIDAASYYVCPCGQPKISDEQRQNLLTWMASQLEAIMTGRIDVCQGETGADFPYMGWAEQSVSEFASAEIIWNDVLRNL